MGELQWKCEGKKETQGGQGGVLLSPSKLLRETYIPPSTSLSSPDSTGSGRPRRRPSAFSQIRPSFIVSIHLHFSQFSRLYRIRETKEETFSLLPDKTIIHRVNPPSPLSVLQTPQDLDQGDQGGDLQSPSR